MINWTPCGSSEESSEETRERWDVSDEYSEKFIFCNKDVKKNSLWIKTLQYFASRERIVHFIRLHHIICFIHQNHQSISCFLYTLTLINTLKQQFALETLLKNKNTAVCRGRKKTSVTGQRGFLSLVVIVLRFLHNTGAFVSFVGLR